jgi:hypothetical protein
MRTGDKLFISWIKEDQINRILFFTRCNDPHRKWFAYEN